ncbi:MAG TPA: hypothetical protein VMA83_05985 [Solirubrobacteraceae bacterium]|nr:hypothetical protein [Solirubrobacteraceae bacterium]
MKGPAKAASRARTTRTTKNARKAPTATYYTAPSTGRDAVASVGETAERAVMIPVGAALIARERVVSSVNDTFSTYTSPSKTQAQLKKFERRGVTARRRLEREIRKTRVRVERDLRHRRREIEKAIGDIEERGEAIASSLQDIPSLAERVQERLQGLV